ncbi:MULTISPECIES: CinA family protein [unclassified Anaerobiospirillum]|uniref:CinA family protein n=1 Tax=unclassified Anaerobiospirillum TaxID=2647410 RepID=UPI001FF39CF5|nr:MULTISPECIES: CinA family protein [unclassified Anaerobiospirillum]MCK0536005.1 CinA family protein [Anaerobiospirillum sp. NML120511]MCK0541170.1 CinA family protein [Anaerobiospirillum sp. NML02-A-032]
MDMNALEETAARFAQDYEQHSHVFATAESCTGGLIGAAITEIAGSSSWFDRGFITYTNEAKQQLLGVSEHVLVQWGAVSVQTACQMVSGALNHSSADIAVAVTGIAGPGGGTELKPVGTVCIAFKRRSDDSCHVKCHHFPGNRSEVRTATVLEALNGLLTLSSGKSLEGYEQRQTSGEPL